MPPLVQQPAERILHRAGRRRKDMGLDRRQMNDVLADEPARDHEAVGIDLVEAEKPLREVADRVTDVHPGLVALVEVDVAQTVGLHHRQLLVLAFTEVRVDDDGAVVAGVNQVGSIAVLLQRRITPSSCHGVVERPGKEEMPRDVDLERGVGILRNDVLIAGQVHQRVVVPRTVAGDVLSIATVDLPMGRSRPRNGRSRSTTRTVDR